MTLFPMVFLTLVATLFLAALLRWLATPGETAERRERGDVVCLLLLVALGEGGSLARDRFVIYSKQYWFANVLLILVCGFALYYIRRLFGAYRGEVPPPAQRKARVLKPPKLDPPNPRAGSWKR